MLKRQEMNSYRTVLSIAGSDSVGGAGIQADIKTCTALGVCAMTAVTALTAQNTQGVSRVAVTDPEMLAAQLRAVADDVRPDAVKTGMLPDAESVELVARFLKERSLTNVVVDPVMVATSGDSLCEDPARTRLLTLLIPLARVVTPNIPEAETLTGIRISDRASMQLAALHLLRHTGCGAVLLKGGHGLERCGHADLLLSGPRELCGQSGASGFAEPIWLEHPHIDTPNTHGTGCTLSSAIASLLARGMDVESAVRGAVDWLAGAIAAGASYSFGHGHGPVNHLYRIPAPFITSDTDV